MSHDFRIWGHRGCGGLDNPPENTIPAVLAAIHQGADGVEFDVRSTSDHVLVIWHDQKLDRLTDGKGRVRDTTFEALRAYGVYDKAQKSPSIGDPKIPMLAEMLDAIEPHLSPFYWKKGYPFKVNIETKGKEAPDRIADEIKARLGSGKWSLENFHVSGFKMDRLGVIHKAVPGLEVGALYVQNLGERITRSEVKSLIKRALRETAGLTPYSLNLPIEYYKDADIAQDIRAAGCEPVAWTYKEKPPSFTSGNDIPLPLRRIVEDGITIITDFPGQMRYELEQVKRLIGMEKSLARSRESNGWGRQ